MTQFRKDRTYMTWASALPCKGVIPSDSRHRNLTEGPRWAEQGCLAIPGLMQGLICCRGWAQETIR